jgi:hypothetical protein
MIEPFAVDVPQAVLVGIGTSTPGAQSLLPHRM